MEFATLILIAAVFLAVILILLLARNDSKPQDRDLFFATPFWRKLQSKNGECCIAKMAIVAGFQ